MHSTTAETSIVQEVAGTRPLVAVGRLPRRSRRSRDSHPPEAPSRRVEWAKPVTLATSLGSQLVARRQAQIRSSSSGRADAASASTLERSRRQLSVARVCALASDQRCHQRWAVAGETLKAAAAAFMLDELWQTQPQRRPRCPLGLLGRSQPVLAARRAVSFEPRGGSRRVPVS